MKILFILILAFSAKGCSQTDLQEIEYTASTRGFYYNISIDQNFIRVSKARDHGDMVEAKITASQWTDLNSIIEKIELDRINQLKAPSTESHSDGAANAEVTIKTTSDEYTSVNFDHKNPPSTLNKLVSKILIMAENN